MMRCAEFSAISRKIPHAESTATGRPSFRIDDSQGTTIAHPRKGGTTMQDMIHCLVDVAGRVYADDGAQSYDEIASGFGLDEGGCQKFRFDLTTRQLLVDRGTASGERTVRTFLKPRVGSPDQIMKFAEEGALPKQTLLNLLASDQRRTYLDACAAIERNYTERCAPANGACLESGCALEGEICLQPLLRSADEYRKACAAEWIRLFLNPRNRIDAWKN
jgi:hypothetical protein